MPNGYKMILNFMVVIIKAPLPKPRNTMVMGKTQHSVAPNEVNNPRNPNFISDGFMIAHPPLT